MKETCSTLELPKIHLIRLNFKLRSDFFWEFFDPKVIEGSVLPYMFVRLLLMGTIKSIFITWFCLERQPGQGSESLRCLYTLPVPIKAPLE